MPERAGSRRATTDVNFSPVTGKAIAAATNMTIAGTATMTAATGVTIMIGVTIMTGVMIVTTTKQR